MASCRLLVTGSRTIFDARVVQYALGQVLYDLGRVDELIHGDAIGVDTLAGAWAKTQNIVVQPVHPKGTFKRAYTERDLAMIDTATHVVAIWDGSSSGTRITMDYAKSKGKLHSLWRLEHVLEELDG